MDRVGVFLFVAGVAFIALAILIQGAIPALAPESRTFAVVDMEGNALETQAYTEQEARGRRVYLREGCWYCHSQYVRPVAGESDRWGPVSQVGEYAFDQPHLFGTRRIGPDLTRVGGKYDDSWHIAHHYNPQLIVPDSIMPSFRWLFEGEDENGVPQLNEDGRALVAYIQKLGTNLGNWRDHFVTAAAGSAIPSTEESVAKGKEVYQRRCIGCHGVNGDGQGPAAPFLDVMPRDFTAGIFKFRSTPSGYLPTDADLYRTITVGVRGTPMPSWHELSEKERWYVIHYIKTFYEGFAEEELDEPPLWIPPEPEFTVASAKSGREIYSRMKCWECHGESGKGDGPKAGTLTDDWGNPIQPYDFTAGRPLKSGPQPEDMYRTFSTGLAGTPMPAFADWLDEEERWDLVHYLMAIRKGMVDEKGEPLEIEEAPKASSLPAGKEGSVQQESSLAKPGSAN